jgi:hypothetical protein
MTTTPREVRREAPATDPTNDPAAGPTATERPTGGGPPPAPEAEEVPELLGERSDFPVPFGEDPGTLD